MATAAVCWAGDGGFAKWDAAQLVSESSCKACHSMAKIGNQYAAWQQSDHAKAFEALKSPAAADVAKKAGVDDPTKSGKCLKCHATAYGFTEASVTADIPVESGVTCQSCHGPAKGYKATHNKDLAAAKENGLIVPTAENTCTRCHNKDNPTDKGSFDFKTSSDKIKHPKTAG
jgi:nitrate/TMAO reductase-like tetraheme cytochrome c subunit